MANRKQKPKLIQIIKAQRFFLLGTALIAITWYMEKTTLEDKKNAMGELDLYYNLGSLIVHDVKLREFQTDDGIIHKNSITDTAEYKKYLVQNVIQEIYQRTGCIHQLKNARDVELDDNSANLRESNARDYQLFNVAIDTNDVLSNSFPKMMYLKNTDRIKFMEMLESVENEVIRERKKLEEDYKRQYKIYLALYIIGAMFISYDKAFKYIQDESAK